MKYSFQCYIKTDNDGVRNSVKQLIPNIDDPRIWDAEYLSMDVIDPDDGINIFTCSIYFNLEADRVGVFNLIKGLAGVINACEKGSFVKSVKSYHDEVTPKSCEVEINIRKD